MNDSRKAPAQLEVLAGARKLELESAWGLFSPKEVDAGTRLLLEHIDVAIDDDCLDIGCGYGPIACSLACRASGGQTVAVDRDFVAVEITQSNAERNGLSNLEARLSNGFSALDDESFDLIASNLPAKVGREILGMIFEDAEEHLRPDGRLVVVVVAGLRELVKREMKSNFGNCRKLKQGARHAVYEATKR